MGCTLSGGCGLAGLALSEALKALEDDDDYEAPLPALRFDRKLVISTNASISISICFHAVKPTHVLGSCNRNLISHQRRRRSRMRCKPFLIPSLDAEP